MLSLFPIPSQTELGKLKNLLSECHVKHEEFGVLVEVAPNKIVRLEIEPICTAEHIQNVINTAFQKLQMEMINNFTGL